MNLVSKISDRKPLKEKPVLVKGCLECDGDLEAYIESQYLAWKGKKIIPLKSPKAHQYICNKCDSRFTPSVKYTALLSDEERKEQINSANDIYARLMVASLVYTALVDGKFNLKEEELLEKVVEEAKGYASTQAVLYKVFELQRQAGPYVFSVFKFAKEHLSQQRLESVVVANARMILVDGKIKTPEANLLKIYLKEAGIDKNLTEILAKAHHDQYEVKNPKKAFKSS